MIILDATTRKLQVLLAGVVTLTEPNWTADWIDILDTDQSVSDIGHSNGNTAGVTAQDMVAAPAASHTRQIKSLTVYNADTAAVTVTVRYNDNATVYILSKTTLQTGESLIYGD